MHYRPIATLQQHLSRFSPPVPVYKKAHNIWWAATRS